MESINVSPKTYLVFDIYEIVQLTRFAFICFADMRKWATIETDHTLFAACGTKSLIENAEPPVIIGHVDAASSVHHFDDNTIEVGMLIDAKDSYGTWFQVSLYSWFSKELV